MSYSVVLVSLKMFVDIDFATRSESRFIPEGLLYLATPLLEAGYEVKICDLAKGDDLLHFEADVFGITALPNQFPQMKEAIMMIRESQPQAKIILGGPFVSCALKWLRDLLDFDLAVIGEGESVIVSAVQEALSGKSNNKRIIQAEHVIKTTDFCLPALELIDINWYLGGKNRPFNYALPGQTLNNILISRGCPNSCNFCRQPFGKKIRVLPERNIDFMLEFYAKAGAQAIRFQDDNWPYLPEKTRIYLLEKLSKLGLQAAFNSRIDSLNEGFLKNISQFSVIKQICFGVESLSRQSLNATKKGTSNEEVRKVVELCREFGIDPAFYIIIGLPDETRDSIETTLEFIEKEKIFAQFQFLLPIPSTTYWDSFTTQHCIEKALLMLDGWCLKQERMKRIFYNITSLTDGELLTYYFNLKKLQKKFCEGV